MGRWARWVRRNGQAVWDWGTVRGADPPFSLPARKKFTGSKTTLAWLGRRSKDAKHAALRKPRPGVYLVCCTEWRRQVGEEVPWRRCCEVSSLVVGAEHQQKLTQSNGYRLAKNLLALRQVKSSPLDSIERSPGLRRLCADSYRSSNSGCSPTGCHPN